MMNNSKSNIMMILMLIMMIGFTSICPAQQADIFQAIHCEPNHASLFPKLIQLVELADSVEIPLTIMFTPQWAQRIMDTPDFLVRVRQWQLTGHEIACHHHGVEAGGSWDGYTNQSETDWPKPEDFYQGDMTAYYYLLSQTAGDSLMLTSCMAAAEYDWPEGLIYLTSGHAVEHAITQPESYSFFGQDVYEVGHGLIKMNTDVQNMIQAYPQAASDDVFGAVTHVNNFNTSESYLRTWFEFIKNKPVKTVRQIMRERGLIPLRVKVSDRIYKAPTRFKISSAYPNPFNPKTTIRVDIYQQSHLKMSVFDLKGKCIDTITHNRLPIGVHCLMWDGSKYASGIYILKVTCKETVAMQKLNLIK